MNDKTAMLNDFMRGGSVAAERAQSQSGFINSAIQTVGEGKEPAGGASGARMELVGLDIRTGAHFA